MPQVIAFPGALRTAAPHAANGLSAEVHRLLSHERPPATAHPGADAQGAPPLGALVARMRADSQELSRSLTELRTAVHALAEADLPGQARALATAVADLDR